MRETSFISGREIEMMERELETISDNLKKLDDELGKLKSVFFQISWICIHQDKQKWYDIVLKVA